MPVNDIEIKAKLKLSWHVNRKCSSLSLDVMGVGMKAGRVDNGPTRHATLITART